MTLDQLLIGKLRLRVLVQALHVGVRGRAIEVVVALLDIFSVIALLAIQAEETFFKDGIAAIPKRQCETEALVVIANAGDTVVTPTVGAEMRLFKREIVPGAPSGL